MMIDTHVHLNVSPLFEEADTYIQAAFDAGVESFIVVGFDPQTIPPAIALADRHQTVKLALGFHPTVVHTLTDEDYAMLEASLSHPSVRAFGEIGLDLHWDKSHIESQITHLHRQLKWAQSLDLPVVIHMRDATQATYDILQQYAPLKGVMHCYSGSLEMVPQFLDLGLHIGLDGPVTFKNARVPKEVASAVPLDRLLLETDAPYLAPHPYRGKTNQPAYLDLIADEIARLRGTSKATIIRATTHNAQALFNV